jgi:hypothetical protein
MTSNSKRRCVVVGLLLIVASVGITLSGSEAFSVSEADRTVTVAVVDDNNAYVGYDSPAAIDVNITEGVDEELVTITNRFHTPIRVTNVEIVNPEIQVSLPPELGVGESGIIRLSGCDKSLSGESVHVTVSVKGAGVQATLFGDTETRTVAVNCHT